MPELPEVETVRNTLKYQILNDTITNVDVYYDRMVLPNKEEFTKSLINQEITDIKRYGKYLIFIFNTCSMISHLRMEGKYFIKEDEPVLKHEHVVFHLKSGRTLRYHDTRKFGILKIVPTTCYETVLKEKELIKLGMEATDDNLNGEYLYEKIKSKSSPIKTTLLDQENICGLGNIYVDEVCFLSSIHPLRKASTITLLECNTIVENCKKVMEGAIKAGGTTIRSYTSSLGVTGLFQLQLHVHTLSGKPCEKCGTIIKKIKVGGRGTYFCENCQRKIPFVIGITGSIASGKSSVLNYLKNHYQDYYYLDSDEIVHKLYEKPEIIQLIKTNFGEEFIENNQISRTKLGEYIFKNEEQRTALNELIHPLVKESLIKEINKHQNDKIIFIDVPLLFEAKMTDLVDEIWCVYVSKEEQLKRLIERDQISEEIANQKIASQMSIEEKKQIASQKQNIVLIDNSSDLCYTYKQIEEQMKLKLGGI